MQPPSATNRTFRETLAEDEFLDYEQDLILAEHYLDGAAQQEGLAGTRGLVAPPVPELEYQRVEFSVRGRARYLARKRLPYLILCAVLFVLGLVIVCADVVRTGYGFYFWADASKGWSWLVISPIWAFILLLVHPLVGYTDRELVLSGYDIKSAEGKKNLAIYRQKVGMRSCCASTCCGCGGMELISQEEKVVQALQSGLAVDADGELLMDGDGINDDAAAGAEVDAISSAMSTAPLQQAAIGAGDDEESALLFSSTRGSAAEKVSRGGKNKNTSTVINGQRLLNKKDVLGRDRCFCCRVCCPVCSCGDCVMAIPKYLLFVWTGALAFFLIWSCVTNIVFAARNPAGAKARARLDALMDAAGYQEVPWLERYTRTDDPQQHAVAAAIRQQDYYLPATWKANDQAYNEYKKVSAVHAGSWYSHEELAEEPYDPKAPKWARAFKLADGSSVLDKADPTASPIYGNYTAGELMEIHRRKNWVPRKIWLYWHSGWDESGRMKMEDPGKEPDPFTVLCLYKIRMEHPEGRGWKVNLISKEWMQRMFPEEEHAVSSLPEFQNIHEGDRARVAVLRRYGGIYMDVSTIITRNFKENGLVKNLAPSRMPHPAIADGGQIDYIGKGLSDVSMFAMPDNCPAILRPFILQPENWFIAAPPQSYYMEMWDDLLHFAFRKPLEGSAERDPVAMHARFIQRVKEHAGCYNSMNDGLHQEDGRTGSEYKTAYHAAYLLLCANGPENAYRGYNFQTTVHASDQTIFLSTSLTAGAILYNSALHQLLSDLFYGVFPLLGGGVAVGYPNAWAWFWFTQFYEPVATREHIKIAGKHPSGGSYSGAITEGISQATDDSIFYRRLIRPLLKGGNPKYTAEADNAMWKKYAEEQWSKTKKPDRACGSSCGAE
mmetsp:Transcript_3120/g.7249  ORF Transcript_3120/g.7249 Transcript_3120/m.7249 type:complete len:891 (-) Transcript_3120:437-3109(-)